MKIELDLSEIFEDEDGERISRSLKDRIEDAIVDKANNLVTKLITDAFEEHVSNQVKEGISKRLEEILTNLMDEEFVPIDKWGTRGKQTTLRNVICSDVSEMLTFKESRYSTDRNVYTEVVKGVVDTKLKEFAREFTRTVDDKLVAECMQFAVNKIKGIESISGGS